MNRWLRTLAARSAFSSRLVCFPHAGAGAAAYRDWAADLPSSVEVIAVQYPGRAERFLERPYTSMPQLVEDLAYNLTEVSEKPYAFFGHSMGAAIAYETALRLRELGCREPARLIVSAREAPQHSRTGTIHLGGEAALIAELHRFGFTDPILLQDPDSRALLLATLAADSELIETYRPAAAAPLHSPVNAIAADGDPGATVAEVADWATITTGVFELTVLPGDHFYVVSQRDQLLPLLTKWLQ